MEINGLNTLERAIDNLYKQGIREYIWLTNYKSDLFELESKRLNVKYKIQIQICKEDFPKGEAGALLDIENLLDDNFFFVNGDIIFDINLSKVIDFHIRNSADITFLTHLTNHPEDSDCIIETPNKQIFKYKLKNEKENAKYFFLGNAGISLMSKNIIKKRKASEYKQSLFKDFIVNSHIKGFKVFSYNTSEYLRDMGTPKRLDQVKRDIEEDKVSKLSYINKQNVLFLDRDNTLIKCEYGKYITSNSKIEFFENRILNFISVSKDYQFIILISNQPQIAMGKITWQEVININGEIIKECQNRGLLISDFYICPHHPHAGFPGEISSLKYNCFCRKPLPGLFLEASLNRNIDLGKSLMIGDSWRDEISAKNAGIKFINAEKFD